MNPSYRELAGESTGALASLDPEICLQMFSRGSLLTVPRHRRALSTLTLQLEQSADGNPVGRRQGAVR